MNGSTFGILYTLPSKIQLTEVEKKYVIIDKKINKSTLEHTRKPNSDTSFYHRVVNKTDIKFINEELVLQNKVLKYNLGRKGKQWISNLTLEAETAATLLSRGEQEYVCLQIAQNIRKLYKQQNQHSTQGITQTNNENRVITKQKNS